MDIKAIETKLSTHKKAAAIVGLCILLALGGFGLGRRSVPVKTVIQEKVRVETQIQEKVVTQVKVETKTVYVKEAARDTHTETTTEKRPDGVVVTKVVEDTHLKTETKDNVDVNKVANKTDDKKETQLVQVEKTVTIERYKPQWSASVLAGYDVAGALGKTTYNVVPSTLPIRHLVLGIGVDRRILGPVFAGAWANTQGTGGLSLRIEF